jgi:hypothetical protein
MVKVQSKEMHRYLHLLVQGLESLNMVKLHMQQFPHLLVPGLESLNIAKTCNNKMQLSHSMIIYIKCESNDYSIVFFSNFNAFVACLQEDLSFHFTL